MDNKAVLKQLLENVPDKYEGFIEGTLAFCHNDKITNGLIAYITKHPEAISDMILDKQNQLEGLKPISDD